jgi:RNA polymerase sigma-70 factor (ECF subfamily)
MVHAILLGRVPPHEVDDLVHDVFLLAMRGLHGLRDVRRFGPWLAAMARNRAVDQRRQHRVMDPIDHDVAASGGGGGAAAGILAAIGKLPEVYRETLIMRLVEGMTGPEIARKTGLRPGSVRVKLHRGMKMLREALGGPGAQMRSS